MPVVVNADGEKLSKQSGAQAIDTAAPLDALRMAGAHLGIANGETSVPAWLAAATAQWAAMQR
ncbi:glutamyl-Q tRNA(Asp) synthetase [compost metagenome]